MAWTPDPHEFEGVFYHWRCSNCDEITQSEDDPRHTEQTCDVCGVTAEVEGDI